MRYLTLFCLVTGLTGSCVSQVNADEWRRFRGTNGSGVSLDGTPPIKWGDDQNVRWRTELPGRGSSSPIISNDRVFVTCFSGEDPQSTTTLKRHLICLDRDSGKIIWHKEVGARQPEDPYRGFLTEHGYASNTPVTDGEHVFAFFGKSGVYAYDLEGNEIWNRHLGSESTRKQWGSASSPILVGDVLVINASEESRAVYGFEKETGKELWKAEAETLGYTYGSPTMRKINGQEDLVLAVPGELWGMNPSNGKLRWYAETGLSGNISPSVIFQDDLAFVFGGYPRTGRAAIRLGGKGDLGPDSLVWEDNHASYIPTPVSHDEKLYWVSDTGIAYCIDASTGKEIYRERLPGNVGGGKGKPIYASPVLANGNLYCVTRLAGTFVIAAQPEFKVLAHNKIANDDTQFNATPSVAGDALYLRSDSAIYKIEER